MAVTEREAGARPLLCSELDVNDLFCNSLEETVREARDDVAYVWSVCARKQLPSECLCRCWSSNYYPRPQFP